MKRIADMTVEELAAFVCGALKAAGVTVTLTGGSCVQIWSEGKYVSHDLDFIEEGPVPRRVLRSALQPLGFVESGRHFVHAETPWIVEFPTGPLMVGEQRVERVAERETSVGTLRLLSPTDRVKDRLAAFYHWSDRQALTQAVLVAHAQTVDLRDLAAWSRGEGHEAKFAEFKRSVRRRKR